MKLAFKCTILACTLHSGQNFLRIISLAFLLDVLYNPEIEDIVIEDTFNCLMDHHKPLDWL